ncbi:hypothetical protein K432DRAFT_307406 [Lepidopterella palustris CBS 459.81]|uniref:Uncharacterized protein n=1 Tax=Lepidopterella palustris CBS 459.81 TaxID=1314670 RepID=A0A8E2JB04_9PEZI|nr:hypothetical protein K432DRAFT_307406 [Lepidopterella palustris CBS 459.81]
MGPLESKRQFVSLDNDAEFRERIQRDLIGASFAKVKGTLNAHRYTNFFQLNLYRKVPVNRQH